MKQSFWDSLIQQLEFDIRRDFGQMNRNPRTQTDERSSEQVDWKLYGELNLRLGGPRHFASARAAHWPRSKKPLDPIAHPRSLICKRTDSPSERQLNETVTQPWPQASSAQAALIWEQLRARGIHFQPADLDTTWSTGVHPRALSRHRKQLLAKHHPDRAINRSTPGPQCQSDRLHSQFIEISELFEQLSELNHSQEPKQSRHY